MLDLKNKWMNEIKKKKLLKERKLCNIFRFIDDLTFIKDSRGFETNYFNIHSEETELGKETSNKFEASFLD